MTGTREAVVIDASVVVALVASPSSVADDIGRRISPAALHAPATLPVEVDSALRGLVLGRHLTIAQADVARQAAHGLPIELWPWHPLADRAWQLRENLSTYDAGYVALAEHLAAPLVTGDARMARASGVSCRVEVFR